MQATRNEAGKFDAYAWPGGYPLVYYTLDCCPLCPACANGENGSDASEDHEDSQWHIVGVDVHWEGEPITCEHCGAQVESAYGDPDAE